MKLGSLLMVVRRRIWLVLSVVLVTMLALMLRLRITASVYEAQVKLQLTAPQQEDVDLYERYRGFSALDEQAVTRNNFTEVLQSREVFDRTAKQLDLADKDTRYDVSVLPVRDSDFLSVSVRASTAPLAASIANAHVGEAIEYYGEVRAQPTTAAKNVLATQLQAAEEKLRSAEEAFTEFKIRNGIATMDGAIAIYHSLLDKLQTERNQRLIEGATSWDIQRIEALIEQLSVERERTSAEGNVAMVEHIDAAIARYSGQLQDLRKNTSATANVDGIIQSRRAELASLVLLAPTYDKLENDVAQATKDRDLILSKYTEATLKETTIKSATFMQVIEPAVAPLRPVPSKQTALLVLALVGSLGVGLMLVFGMDYVANLKIGYAISLTRLIWSGKNQDSKENQDSLVVTHKDDTASQNNMASQNSPVNVHRNGSVNRDIVQKRRERRKPQSKR